MTDTDNTRKTPQGEGHTPGPWFVDDSKGPIIGGAAKATIGIWAQKRFDDALKSDNEDLDPEDEKWLCGAWGACSDVDFANARLIAAAPDMLASLRLVLETCKMSDNTRRTIDAALAKATGGAA